MWYALNKSYIVKEVCVQRYAEVNTCQGCCTLNMELENEPIGEDAHSTMLITQVQKLNYIVPATDECERLDCCHNALVSIINIDVLSDGHTQAVFRPPIV